MVSLRSEDGTRIKWDNVASAVLGGILGAIGLGLADLVDVLVSIPAAVLNTITTAFSGPGATALFEAPARLIGMAVDSAVAFIGGLGILGFPLALGLVIATAWLAAKIREEVA